MSSYITRNLKTKVYVFIKGTPDGYGGNSFTKTTLNGRWEDKQELIINAAGEQALSQAVCYLDGDVNIGDWLSITSSTASIPDPQTAKKVVQFRKMPNLSNTMFERKAYLYNGN